MSKWFILAAAILLEVTATLSLKGAIDTPWLYAIVVAGYIGSSGVALTALFSFLIYREPITPVMGMGIGLIIVGVLCVELGSQAAHRKSEREVTA